MVNFLKIAICDDEVNDINVIYQNIRAHSSDHDIHQFTDPEIFLERLFHGEHFDLLFLDVQMHDSDGWQIAKEIKESKINIFIAMVTVLDGYIYDCFDRVDWFAPKPISKQKVIKILDIVQEKLCPEVFEFQADGISISLTMNEILYIEVQRNDLIVHSPNAEYKVRMPLKKALSILAPFSSFVQIHKSYVVNLAYYKEVDKMVVVLKNGQKLKLTKTYKENFYKGLSEYIRGV